MSVEYSIPEKKPKKEKTIKRDYVKLPPNLADDSEKVKKFWEFTHANFTKFRDQQQRLDLTNKLAKADKMWRAGVLGEGTKLATDQQQDTLSKVSSTQFFRVIRTIWTEYIAILLSGTELPAKYKARVSSPDYTDEEGTRIAEGENLLLKKSWNDENWDQIIREIIKNTLKNTMCVTCLEWEYRTETKPERVPGYYSKRGEPTEMNIAKLKAGEEALPERAFEYGGEEIPIGDLVTDSYRPRSFVFKEKTRIKKEGAILRIVPLKDFYCDLSFDSIQKQQTTIERYQSLYSDLMKKQDDGFYINVDKLTDAQLFKSEDFYDSEVAQKQIENAGETFSSEPTGMMDNIHCFGRISLEDNGMPEWYEGVFCGDFNTLSKENSGNDGGCICLQLRKLPAHSNKIPYSVTHSHQDDKGMNHIGLVDLMECLFEEWCVTLDQYIDNKNKRDKRPWIAEWGNIMSSDLVFHGGNDVKWVRSGTSATALTQLEVGDTTGTTLPFLEFLQKQINETGNTDKPVTGTYAGARTTRTEFLGVREQAMKPIFEEVKYFANDFFPWLLNDFKDLNQQYCNPSRAIAITGGDEATGSVNPAELYGELDVQVVCVDEFKSNMMLRETLVDLFKTGFVEKFQPLMGDEGVARLGRDFMRLFGIKDVNKILPATKPYIEAETLAWNDVRRIENDPADALINGLPTLEEKHDVALRILEPRFERYKTMIPQDQQNADIIRAYMTYIMMHRQFQEEGKQKLLAEGAGPGLATPGLEAAAGGGVPLPTGAPALPTAPTTGGI